MQIGSASPLPTQAYFALGQQQQQQMPINHDVNDAVDMSIYQTQKNIDIQTGCMYHLNSPIQYSPAPYLLTPNSTTATNTSTYKPQTDNNNRGNRSQYNKRRNNYRNNKTSLKTSYKRDDQASYTNEYFECDQYQQQQAYQKQQAEIQLAQYNNYYMEQMYYAQQQQQQQQQQMPLTPDQSIYGTNENSVDNEFNGTNDFYYNSATNEYYTRTDNSQQVDNNVNIGSANDLYDDDNNNPNADDADGSQLACQTCRGRRMCFCYFLKVGYYKFPSYVDLVDFHYKKWRTNASKQKVF